jgi:hypothetical protein
MQLKVERPEETKHIDSKIVPLLNKVFYAFDIAVNSS